MSTATPTMTYQALYRACMKEAAGQGRTLMQRLIGRAGDSLPRRATFAPDEFERRLLREAAKTLLKHDVALCEAYPQALLEEFAHAISGDSRKAGALSFDALELMGDDQMRENVELMRLQQLVAHQVEAELTDLNSLVSSVQGLQSVQPDRNPLRPEIYVRSLRTVLQQSPVPHAVRARWMVSFGEALGPELARVYRELALWLREQGVADARYHATPSAETPAAATLNINELRQLLSGELVEVPPAKPAAPERPPEFSVTLPAAFQALKNKKELEEVIKRVKQRQPSEPRAAAQAIAQEVVKLMVENIASDARLLPPVQASVRELEPALMRLAHDDPRFFSDRKHPARRLLDELTQRSLAWQSVDTPGFAAFVEPLQQAVEVLRTTQVEGAAPFEFALNTLGEAWGELQHRDRHHREKAVRALLQAEQRNLLADRIAKEMRNRPDVAGAPREIIAFVAGPWSQVMAQARLLDTSGSPDPAGFTSLVTDLVWSAQPRVAATQSARLAKLAPVLIERLRQGLASIDFPATATQRFLAHLAQAHREALQAASAEALPAASLLTSLSREELESMMGESVTGEGAGAWLAPSEAQHSGFIDTHQTLAPKPLFQSTQPAGFNDTQPDSREATPDIPVAELQPGAWVEMMTPNGWARCQVTWASPHGTLFMFSGASGQPQSMTKRLLGKMLHGGTLRLVSGQALVDGALDAVAQTALRNSLS